MNEKVMRHKALCDGLNELYARKNHDYGDSFHQTFVEEGLAMTRIRLGDKFSRFKTLSRISPTTSDQQQVTDESIRDTLLDLANYAIMTVLELDIKEGIVWPDESSMNKFPADRDIFLQTGEKKLAAVLNHIVKPNAKGQFDIELTGVYVNHNVILAELEDFDLVIYKPDSKIIYSGCQWSNIGESGTLGRMSIDRMSITAKRRKEIRP